MSEFAFFRESKEEIIKLTEEVLDAKGIECDSSISKISEDELIGILAQVRELRKKKQKKSNKLLEQQEEHTQ
jgi:hypothetical protein